MSVCETWIWERMNAQWGTFSQAKVHTYIHTLGAPHFKSPAFSFSHRTPCGVQCLMWVREAEITNHRMKTVQSYSQLHPCWVYYQCTIDTACVVGYNTKKGSYTDNELIAPYVSWDKHTHASQGSLSLDKQQACVCVSVRSFVTCGNVQPMGLMMLL